MEADNVLYQGAYFSIRCNEQGDEYVKTDSEVLVVPLTEASEVMMALEPSIAFREPVLILPGGKTEPDEEPGETAGRELREEIGYAPGRLDFLGALRPFSKYLAMRSLIYLARDLRPGKLMGDEAYAVQTVSIPLATFENLFTDGRISDARVIAALYMTRHFLQQEAH